MQLFYRGVTYEFVPCTVETVETSTTARFLGVNYRIRRPVNGLTVSPNSTVRYRGIPYIRG